MADVKITALPASAGLATVDLFPVVDDPGGAPATQKATIAQLITLLDTIYAPITGGAYVLKAGDTMTGKLTIAQATANTSILASSGYSLTGADTTPMIDLTGTWNTTGVPSAIRLNITNTASNASSLLLDLQVGGALRFGAYRNGDAEISGIFYSPTFYQILSRAKMDAGGFSIDASYSLAWCDGNVTGTKDVLLFRDAASVLALRDTTIAQTFRWYRTFTDAANYERGALQTAAGQVIVAAETAGTGTDDIDLVLTPAGVGRVTLPGGAQLLKTTAAMTSGAAAALGTLTNAPTAGNAAVWCPIMFNGVQHWFPCWT